MSILVKKKTTESYLEKMVTTLPVKSWESSRSAIRNFIKFSMAKYGTTSDEICHELVEIRKSKGEEEYEDALYSLLQEWIDWNITIGTGNYTIRTRFSLIRSYLYYLGVKTNSQDIKQLLKFPKKIQEERHPLRKQELKDLVLSHSRHPVRQALYLACSSSGMRMGEALKICKKDLDFSLDRIMVRIKPEYTKTKQARTTILSKECEQKIRTYLDKLDDNDLVFSKSKKDVMRTEQQALGRALKTLGYTEKYSSNGFYKITSHSFRAYFFTAAARKHGENYAHKLVGHGGYLMQYDRLTDEDKLKMYIELEPDLVVFDQTKNELEIEKLRDENLSIKELREEVKKLRENQAKQDRRVIEDMRKDGILPPIEEKSEL